MLLLNEPYKEDGVEVPMEWIRSASDGESIAKPNEKA